MHAEDRLIDVCAYIHDNCNAQESNGCDVRVCVCACVCAFCINVCLCNVFVMRCSLIFPHTQIHTQIHTHSPLREFVSSLSGREPSKVGWKKKALGGLMSGVKAIAG
jgi:hypothetical protein